MSQSLRRDLALTDIETSHSRQVLQPHRADSIPIWVTLSIAPVVSVLAMVGLAVVAFVVTSNLRADLTRLERDVVVPMERIYALRLAFVTAEARLLDLSAYAANSDDGFGLVRRSQAVEAALRTVREQVRAGGHDAGLDDGGSRLTEDIRQWQFFAADAAATLIEDSAVGLMYIADVQTFYDKITAALEKTEQRIRDEKNETLRSAWRRMAQTNAVAPIAVLGIGMMVGALSLLAAREISRKIRMFRVAMTEIASGHLDTAIPLAKSDDEMSRMADALEELRRNKFERRVAERKIVHMAHHDALTGLANRALFQDRINGLLQRCGGGAIGAVLYVDLDHFKAVNDTFGHAAGDALLQAVTQRLRSQVRDTDTVARLGGDEFAVLAVGLTDSADVALLAQGLIEAVSAPYDLGGEEITIGASIGIARVPRDGTDGDQLMKCADMALYRSKGDGRGQYNFFDPAMDARMQFRRTLELNLRRALVDEEFRVFYQPLINIASGRVSGFEALIRWFHPERGMIGPGEFIPLAEETRLVVQIGTWVLRRACADAMTWPGDTKVAVNLSPVQLTSDTLLDDLKAALASSGLPANRLELEITETALLEETHSVLGILRQIQDLGIRIALDDFGTGYSSLSHLRRYPIGKVKIDRSFVDRLGQDRECDTIVSAVVNLCAQLGITTTAEGVETEAQLRILSALRCTEAQGYLFSKPRPAAEAIGLCESLGAVSV